jgi:hypothetical protein
MNRNRRVASVGCVAGLVAALSAQATSSNGKVDQKTIHSLSLWLRRALNCAA